MPIPECHPDRPYQAKGLCARCYWKQYDAARAERRNAEKRKDPSEYKKRNVPARMSDCHPDRKHYAVGLCNPCYRTARKAAGAGRATCHPERPVVARGLCEGCYKQDRYWGDPEKARAEARTQHAALRKRVRDELVAAYGGKCACANCPEANSAFLTLDHINGDGRAHRMKLGSHTYADLRRRGWPKDGYRLLCWNCNAMTRGGQQCPHETET